MGKLFSPAMIAKMTMKEIRKEYSNLRSIANKRIARLREQNLGSGVTKFGTIQDIVNSSKMSLSSALADVSKFLRSERTTVRGEKKFINDFREQMIERGYGDLVKDIASIYQMIDFMEHMREQYSDKIFDSGDALDVLQEAQRLKIPTEKVIEHFDEFATNLSDLEKVKPSRNGNEFSQRRINNLIKKWNK